LGEFGFEGGERITFADADVGSGLQDLVRASADEGVPADGLGGGGRFEEEREFRGGSGACLLAISII